MILSTFFNTIFGHNRTLTENHQEIEQLKQQSSELLDATVHRSTLQSAKAGRKFDRMGDEMQLMAGDIAIRIAKAAGRP
jgi:hypothetical protein